MGAHIEDGDITSDGQARGIFSSPKDEIRVLEGAAIAVADCGN